MIPFTCPKCGTELEVPQSEAGKKVACPDCGTRLLVMAPAKKTSGAASGVTKRPTARGPAGGGGTRRPNGKPAPRPDTKKRRPRDDEDDDEDEAPRGKKKGKNKKGSSSGLLIGLGVGGGVLVVGGVIVAIALAMSGKGNDNKQANATSKPPVVMPGGTSPAGDTQKDVASVTDVSSKPDKKDDTKKDDDAKDDVPAPIGPVSDAQIYKYLLKAVVLIIRPEAGGFSQGSGSIIDKTNRLILTNFHVAKEAGTKVFIFFPARDKDGNLISDRNHFLQEAKADAALKGTTVWSDSHVDLALVQLGPEAKLPDDCHALAFASHRPEPGDRVLSIGNPGTGDGKGTLWVPTPGEMRQFKPKEHWVAGDATLILNIDADIVLTNSSTNHGDSGGPLVNERGELVAVVQGAYANANQLSIFIALSEVKNLVASYERATGAKLDLMKHSELAAEADKQNLPKLLRRLASKDKDKRADAARDIGAMGTGGQAAVPDLLKLLVDDPDEVVRKMALEALNKIGAPALSDLQTVIDALKSKNAQARLYATRALAELGPDGRSAVPALLEALKDQKDPALRRNAARALGAVGLDAKEEVQPALITAMKDDTDASVREVAAKALPVLPMSPADAPVLVELLTKSKDAAVRAGAARALAKTGADAKTAVKSLADALGDPSAPVRQAALEGLARFGPDAKDHVKTMVHLLRDPDPRVGQAAADALGAVGPDAKSAAKALADAAQSPELRKQAVAALMRIGHDAAKEAAPLLVNMLNVSSAADRLLALTALAGLKPSGAEAAELAPRVIRAFEDRDPKIRAQAAVTLGQFGRPAVPALIKALADPNKNVRIGAVNALGNIGAPAGNQARNQVSLLSQVDRDPDVQKACAAALAAMQR